LVLKKDIVIKIRFNKRLLYFGDVLEVKFFYSDNNGINVMNFIKYFDETWIYNQNDSGSMKRLVKKLKKISEKSE